MYNLELNRVISEVKKEKAKRVCIQLPEGLKPKAQEIADAIEKETSAKVVIWAGSCYGGCDVPELGGKVDMLIQWGHSRWK